LMCLQTLLLTVPLPHTPHPLLPKPHPSCLLRPQEACMVSWEDAVQLPIMSLPVTYIPVISYY
jgi:hypothetical protein